MVVFRGFQDSSRFLRLLRIFSRLIYSSSRTYLGFNSSIFLIKSPFSKHPLPQDSPQSAKIFLSSFTRILLRLMFFQSSCFSYLSSQIWESFGFNFSQTFSAGMWNDSGLVTSLTIVVAASSVAPM